MTKTAQLRKKDLIDTQWNVNYNELLPDVRGGMDLIDTQWNVNEKSSCETLNKTRFNRYIVECK